MRVRVWCVCVIWWLYNVPTLCLLSKMAKTQKSISFDRSESWSDLDPVVSLPYEAASHIMNFVPPRELLKVCMLVSRSWKDFLSDPVFWKARMKQSGNYSPHLHAIANIDWPRLYMNTIFEPNLIKSFDKNGELTLKTWRVSSKPWETFKTAPSAPDRDRDWDSQHCEWEIENKWIKPESDAELIKESNGCLQNYVTSYMWCCRDQVIELAKVGLSDEIMDDIQPAIEVSEWFSARWDCGSTFCIRVELLGADKKVVRHYEHSETTDQWQGGELGWRKVRHVFSGYGGGVRFLRFADAGKDTQFWAGHYGSKMAAAWARIWFSEPT